MSSSRQVFSFKRGVNDNQQTRVPTATAMQQPTAARAATTKQTVDPVTVLQKVHSQQTVTNNKFGPSPIDYQRK